MQISKSFSFRASHSTTVPKNEALCLCQSTCSSLATSGLCSFPLKIMQSLRLLCSQLNLLYSYQRPFYRCSRNYKILDLNTAPAGEIVASSGKNFVVEKLKAFTAPTNPKQARELWWF